MDGLLDLETADGIGDSGTGGCGATNTITCDFNVPTQDLLDAVARTADTLRQAAPDELRNATVALTITVEPEPDEMPAETDTFLASEAELDAFLDAIPHQRTPKAGE